MMLKTAIVPDCKEPLSIEEFSISMNEMGVKSDFAVAISGGADSLALAILSKEWAKQNQTSITAITIDHGLRKESAREAEQVSLWMKERGIPHHILNWTGLKPTSGLQAKARKARFDLLSNWCSSNQIHNLILGHHKDDQEETFLLRLSRGSGPIGLASMAPIVQLASIRLLRPLLNYPKSRLEAYLKNIGQQWIEDPSNQELKFARVRARKIISEIPSLTDALDTRNRSRAGMDLLSGELITSSVDFHSAGFCNLDLHLFFKENPEIAFRALSRVLSTIGGKPYGPKTKTLERVKKKILNGHCGSLHGTTLFPNENSVLIVRENRNIKPIKISPGEQKAWDGRFTVKLLDGPEGMVGSLGEIGWKLVKHRAIHKIPYPVRVTLPAFWVNGYPIAVPSLGIKSSETDFSAIFHGIDLGSRFKVVSSQEKPI